MPKLPDEGPDALLQNVIAEHHAHRTPISEVLGQLDEDRELTRLYGTRAYNRARERFTARRMVDDYLRLYRRLRTSKVAVA